MPQNEPLLQKLITHCTDPQNLEFSIRQSKTLFRHIGDFSKLTRFSRIVPRITNKNGHIKIRLTQFL